MTMPLWIDSRNDHDPRVPQRLPDKVTPSCDGVPLNVDCSYLERLESLGCLAEALGDDKEDGAKPTIYNNRLFVTIQAFAGNIP